MNERRTFQKGYIFKVGRTWYGRWRREEFVEPVDLSSKERANLTKRGVIIDGSRIVVSRQHAERLCEYGDRYRSKKDVQPLLDTKLLQLNRQRCRPESTLTVAAFTEEFFFPRAKGVLKPSTIHGYDWIWRTYLAPRLRSVNVCDFRCMDATNLLASIHCEHGIGRNSLGHCKALLSSIFKFAKTKGVIDGENPVRDAEIPHAAAKSKPTYAYTAGEVIQMLNALTGTAKTAVALMFFAGLRPGEARGLKWTDYDEKGRTLHISRSMWQNFVTEPKTPESVAAVPVAETLAQVLVQTPRLSEDFVLASAEGKPIDLHNLAVRTIRPTMALCRQCHKPKREHGEYSHQFKALPVWRGYYALRRGCATLATQLDNQIAAKSLLRHSNIATTQQFYIKSLASEALSAVTKMDALFQVGDSVPN